MQPSPLNPPPSKALFNLGIAVEFKTKIMDAATGLCVKESPWRKNLVLDAGLNALAQSTNACGIGSSFSSLRIGGGTNPTSFASGAITFTQSTTSVTASGGFFTSAMVGGILKYGTGSGGAEQYITAFTSSTLVTVSSSATVAATVGTIWMVQQTALQTPLFTTSTYQTTAGSNSTTYSAGQQLMQRTFVNGVQGAPYTVNELGWNVNSGGTAINGRIVLPSSDVVGTSNFYVVIMQLTVTFAPSAPTAVGNVGTGLNTAGNAMIEWFDFTSVSTNGNTNPNVSVNIDGPSANLQTSYITASYSQQSSLTSSTAWPLVVGSVQGQTSAVAFVYSPGTVGICTCTTTSTSTTAGQTCTGIALTNPGNSTQIAMDVKLTTPFTLPTGTFIHTTVWQIQYSRTLVN